MNWLLLEGRSESGPFTLDQLRQLASEGKLNPQSQLRDPRNKRVIPAHQIMGLFPELTNSSGNVPTFQQPSGAPVKSQQSMIQAPSEALASYRESQKPTAKSRLALASIAAALLLALSAGGYFLAQRYFFPPPPPVDLQAQANQKPQELQDRISRWKNERVRVEGVLKSLQEDRDGLIWQFQRLGYYSTTDANDSPRGQALLQELRSLTEQLVRLNKKKEEYSLAVFQSESKLRTIDRSLQTSRVLENEAEIAELFAAVSAADSALAAETGASPDVEVEQEIKTLLADLQDDEVADLEWGTDATVIMLDVQPRDLKVSCFEQPGVKIEGSGRYRRVLVPDSLVDSEIRLDFIHPKFPTQQRTVKPGRRARENVSVNLTEDLTASKPDLSSFPKSNRTNANEGTSPHNSDRRPLNTEEVVAATERSVVRIIAPAEKTSGSGFIVSKNLVATNYHVIADAKPNGLEIFFPSVPGREKTSLPGRTRLEIPEHDLAFVEIEAEALPLQIDRNHSFRRGQEVVVIGSPGLFRGSDFLPNAVTKGILSAIPDSRTDLYQLSITLNSGNSGGPAIGMDGKVIGVITSKSITEEGIAFCIPASILETDLAIALALPESEIEKQDLQHEIRRIVRGMFRSAYSYTKQLERFQQEKPDLATQVSANELRKMIEEIMPPPTNEVETVRNLLSKNKLDNQTRKLIEELIEKRQAWETSWSDGSSGTTEMLGRLSSKLDALTEKAMELDAAFPFQLKSAVD